MLIANIGAYHFNCRTSDLHVYMYATTSTVTKEVVAIAVHELGLEALKPKQRDAIVSLSGNDTLVVLPTGYG